MLGYPFTLHTHRPARRARTGAGALRTRTDGRTASTDARSCRGAGFACAARPRLARTGHGDADVGLLERGRIVDAVASHGNHVVPALQHGHDLVLVLREHLRKAVGLLHQLLGRLVDAVVARVVHVLRAHARASAPRPEQLFASLRAALLARRSLQERARFQFSLFSWPVTRAARLWHETETMYPHIATQNHCPALLNSSLLTHSLHCKAEPLQQASASPPGSLKSAPCGAHRHELRV